MNENQNSIREVEIELELRRRRTATQKNSQFSPKQEPSSGVSREAKILAQGVAGGIGSMPGFVADVASIPTRTAGGLMAIAGDVTGTPSLRKTGEGLFFAPSFTTKATDAAGGAVGRAINAPTDLNAGEKARKTGAEFVGSMLAGGAVKGALQAGGKALMQGAPRASQALQAVANSRGVRLMAPSRPADIAGAYGAGAGSEYLKQYADPNSMTQQIGASLIGGIGGGALTGGLARTAGRGVERSIEGFRPNTGVGESMVGPVKEINPEQQFGALAGSLRAAAANAEKQVNSKYRNARELSAGSSITPIGINTLKGRISALIAATAGDDKKLHQDILSNLNQLVAEKGGLLTIDDVAENLRRQYSNASHKYAFAKKEGIPNIDNFLLEAVDNTGLTNGIGKKASKAWKEAILASQDASKKFKDPSDIAKIIGEEAATGRPLAPAQVGAMFKPSANNSNLMNKWDSALAAVPGGIERKRLGQTIKSGIFHDILKNAQDSTPSGFVVNEGKLLSGLDDLIKDPAFKRKYTAAEQGAFRKLQASLSGTNISIKKAPQLLGAIFNTITGQPYFTARMGSEALIGPATTTLDNIIKMLEKPLPFKRTDSNFTGSVVAPTILRETLPVLKNPNPQQQIEPQTSIQQPQRRLSYAEAKRQKGIA